MRLSTEVAKCPKRLFTGFRPWKPQIDRNLTFGQRIPGVLDWARSLSHAAGDTQDRPVSGKGGATVEVRMVEIATQLGLET